MSSRLPHGLILLLLVLGVTGCFQGTSGTVDEERSPYLIAGRDWAAAHDYEKAMTKFHKALEVNPGSALAHFELGVLNEQHRKDFVSAIYHYQRALELRPNAYPADNARGRIASCKQELVKEESLAPVAQNMLRELDQLRKENAELRGQLAALRGERTPASSPPGPTATRLPDPVRGAAAIPTPPDRSRHARTHIVKAGETPYSISRAFNISVQQFMQANPGVEARSLSIGQRVNIPVPRTTVTSDGGTRWARSRGATPPSR